MAQRSALHTRAAHTPSWWWVNKSHFDSTNYIFISSSDRMKCKGNYYSSCRRLTGDHTDHTNSEPSSIAIFAHFDVRRLARQAPSVRVTPDFVVSISCSLSVHILPSSLRYFGMGILAGSSSIHRVKSWTTWTWLMVDVCAVGDLAITCSCAFQRVRISRTIAPFDSSNPLLFSWNIRGARVQSVQSDDVFVYCEIIVENRIQHNKWTHVTGWGAAVGAVRGTLCSPLTKFAASFPHRWNEDILTQTCVEHNPGLTFEARIRLDIPLQRREQMRNDSMGRNEEKLCVAWLGVDMRRQWIPLFQKCRRESSEWVNCDKNELVDKSRASASYATAFAIYLASTILNDEYFNGRLLFERWMWRMCTGGRNKAGVVSPVNSILIIIALKSLRIQMTRWPAAFFMRWHSHFIGGWHQYRPIGNVIARYCDILYASMYRVSEFFSFRNFTSHKFYSFFFHSFRMIACAIPDGQTRTKWGEWEIVLLFETYFMCDTAFRFLFWSTTEKP